MNKFYMTGMSLLSFALVSCGDSFLDVTPADQLSDATFWQSETDADRALTGCWMPLPIMVMSSSTIIIRR